jgi:hypothetical protein
MNKSNLRRTYKIFKLYEKYISENTNPISLIEFIKVTDSIIPIENIRTIDTTRSILKYAAYSTSFINGNNPTLIVMDEYENSNY